MSVLRAAAIFSDHMVLQRGKPVKVWGMDYPNRTVTVEIDGRKAASSVKGNKWEVTLPPFESYGGSYEMTVSDGIDSVVYRDIVIGEVWLAGGQSNMELELQSCSTGHEELEHISESGKNVRFYYTPKNPYKDDFFYAQERDTCWSLSDRESSKCWSAVGYYFAKKLSAELNCTVGVIGCNWGGTSASNWISHERLCCDSDTKSYVDEYDKAMEGKTFEDYLEDLEEYRRWEAEWQPKINEYYSLHPDGSWDEAQEYAGSLSRWPEPLGPKSPFRAAGLYETMLMRVCPYTLAGFIYYQGESDDHKPQMYAKLFSMLIEQWRSDWNDDGLPFICVQLPMFINKGEEDRKNWCLIREAQMHVHQTTANTGIAVILDCGEYGNIHPVNKVPVGDRLALQALANVYGTISPEDAYGPIYRCCYPVGDSMAVRFDYSDGMYVVGEDGTRRNFGNIDGFEISGADGVYCPAEAELKEDGTVIVRSDKVTEPVNVRFMWVNYGNVTLFNKNGIPAAPFRSNRK